MKNIAIGQQSQKYQHIRSIITFNEGSAGPHLAALTAGESKNVLIFHILMNTTSHRGEVNEETLLGMSFYRLEGEEEGRAGQREIFMVL